MSAKVISSGIQKGGSSKTTSSGITAYILAEAARVLAVDMDSQGNLTELLTGHDVIEYRGKTVLEAMQDRDATDYIIPITDSLHILPAEDLLATFSRWLYRDFKGGDPDLGEYILAAVTQGLTYETCKTRFDIPCSRDTYYDRYRKFFWLLHKVRD